MITEEKLYEKTKEYRERDMAFALGNNWRNPKHVRGHRPLTKVFGESGCVVCGVLKTPKILKNGRYESPYNIVRRKTCGNDWLDGKIVAGECYKKFISGKGNGNYKGYVPMCKVCGKRISYNNAKEMKKGIVPKYCGTCWIKKMKKDKKGIYPEHLKPYAFKKGAKE